jgi:NAD(P)-dependent dehydrogenase (short-subunit alcohol dehydrogenase family)
MASQPAPVYAVLGATGGVGSEVCRRLARQGARLVLGARSEESLTTLAKDVDGTAHALDATRFEEVQAFVDRAVETYGQLDGIASCVGSILLKPAHLTSVEEFQETLALNLHSAFFTVKAVARTMMGQQQGSIVLVSSAVTRTGIANHEAIAAAKAGIEGLTRSAAATYANRGVRVNCVAPGLVQTPATERITKNEASRKQSAAMHALGRLGEPHDVASAVCWLLDEAQSSWVTGQVLGVDGGLGSVRPR